MALAQEYEFGSASLQSVAGVVTLLPSSPSTVTSHPGLMALGTYRTSAELSYRQVFGLGELEDFAFQARHRVSSADYGASASRFGQSGLYQEYSIAIGLARRIGNAGAVGLSEHYSSEEYGDGEARFAGAFLAINGAYQIVPSVLLSAAVREITLDRVYEGDDTDPILEASIAWTSASEVSLGAIWTRESNGDHRFALGQILSLGQYVDFLAGLRFDPVRYSLGGRASYRQTGFVYTYQGHPDLGGTHAFGLTWDR